MLKTFLGKIAEKLKIDVDGKDIDFLLSELEDLNTCECSESLGVIEDIKTQVVQIRREQNELFIYMQRFADDIDLRFASVEEVINELKANLLEFPEEASTLLKEVKDQLLVAQEGIKTGFGDVKTSLTEIPKIMRDEVIGEINSAEDEMVGNFDKLTQNLTTKLSEVKQTLDKNSKTLDEINVDGGKVELTSKSVFDVVKSVNDLSSITTIQKFAISAASAIEETSHVMAQINDRIVSSYSAWVKEATKVANASFEISTAIESIELSIGKVVGLQSQVDAIYNAIQSLQTVGLLMNNFTNVFNKQSDVINSFVETAKKYQDFDKSALAANVSTVLANSVQAIADIAGTKKKVSRI